MKPDTHNPCDSQPGSTHIARLTLYAFLILTPTLLAYDGNLDGNLDLYHEGERLAAIDALRDGALPFRDIYIPHGLGEDILKPLLACRLFGDSVESLRRLGQNSYFYRGLLPPLGLAAILLAGAVLLRRPGLLALLAAMLLAGLYEVTDRHILGFLAWAALAQYLHTRRLRWLYLAGLGIGGATLYSLEVGLYMGAAASVWLILDAWLISDPTSTQSPGLPLAAGLLSAALVTILLPFLIWCGWHGIVSDLFQNVQMQLFERKELYPAPYPVPDWHSAESLMNNLRVCGGLLLMFYAIPGLILAGVGIAIRNAIVKKRSSIDSKDPPGERLPLPYGRGSDSALLLTSLVAACFWATVIGRPDLWHLAFATGPFFLFAAIFLAYLFRKTPGSNDTEARNARHAASSQSRSARKGRRKSRRASASRRSDTPPPCPGPSRLFRCGRIAVVALTLLAIASLVDFGQGGILSRRLFDHENRFLPEYLQTKGRKLVKTSIPRLGHIRLRPDQASYLEPLVAYIREHTSDTDTILDLSDQGLLYFLCQRRSPSRYHFVNYCGTPELRRILVDEVRGRGGLPRYVIRYQTDQPTPDALGEFVTRNYQPEIRIGPALLLVRSGTAP
ncbi:MAG: hypothetical protein ACE5EC_03035 [Phycisphaerae bacterium]